VTSDAVDWATSEELRFLRMKFSTGVRLAELTSVATLAAVVARIKVPSRDTKRSFPLMVAWFRDNWAEVLPYLPLMQLRDTDDRPIDMAREIDDRQPHGHVSAP
jgi:hypothetical protein